MKYSFTINQVAAVQLGDVDLIDCAIIEWIRDLCASRHPRIADNRIKGFTWISYQYAIDDMPMLGLNTKEAFRKRLQGIISKGYLRTHTENQRVYVKPTPKLDELFFQPEGSKTLSTTVNNSRRHRQPQLTAPHTAEQGSTVNHSRLTHNSYTNTQSSNSGLGGKPLDQRKPEDKPTRPAEPFDGPTPTLEEMRKAKEAGLKPWEYRKLQNDDNTGPTAALEAEAQPEPTKAPEDGEKQPEIAEDSGKPSTISPPADAGK